MDTQTIYCLDVPMAEELVSELKSAINLVRAQGGTSFARGLVEQAVDKGPWRLVLSITDGDG